MRGEEIAEFGMVLRIAIVIDQRQLLGERASDVGMLDSEVAPYLKLLHVQVARVGGHKHGRGISVDDGSQRFSFLCNRWSRERDGKGHREEQSR
jgi:hypothetical protein